MLEALVDRLLGLGRRTNERPAFRRAPGFDGAAVALGVSLLLLALLALGCGRPEAKGPKAPPPEAEEAEETPEPAGPPADAPLAVVMDVDGTIADETRRRLAAAGTNGELDGEAEWDAYFDPARIDWDTPIVEARATLLALADSGVKILYVTARSEEICPATETWIAKHGFPAGPVRCRDRRARTHDFKVEAIRDLARAHRIVAGVGQEDRDGPPYREAGIEGVYVAENDEAGWRETVRPRLVALVEKAGEGGI